MSTPAAPSGVDWEAVEAVGTWVSALLGLITTIVAALVFFEARSIRSTEWFAKTVQNWQDFNRLVIEFNYGDRWKSIIAGHHKWKDFDQRDFMYVYSFLNVLVFEFRAEKRHLLERKYAEKSVKDNIAYFRHIWPDLRVHLTGDGWPEEFLPFADQAIREANAAAAAKHPKAAIL